MQQAPLWLPIDEAARTIAVEHYGFRSACLHIPVAARAECDIATYVGPLAAPLASPRVGRQNVAWLVEPVSFPKADARLPLWAMPNSPVLHRSRQVWVHVDFRGYRAAYAKAFPSENLAGVVIDHVMNRRQARVYGFAFLRVVAIGRAANSSSGGLSEKWGVDYARSVVGTDHDCHRQARIRYADLADIVKMLDKNTGGSIQDGVCDALEWITPRP